MQAKNLPITFSKSEDIDCFRMSAGLKPVYLMLLGWSLAPQYWLGVMQHESGTWKNNEHFQATEHL